MSFFITNAMAAATPAPASQADGAFPLVMLVAIFVLFYFMIIRPNNKRAKEHRELISNLKKGDEIVTSGGILAKVANIDEQFIRISIAEGVDINVQRNAVVAVLPKGTIKAL
ncbi:preprotein translocase subunit YajC [Legionella gresilensis]|uniref:preprotein translocase subunit YajC n=1 Tax=Legionella gresilensis TaxID=91823 RepID=UPI001040E81C|nr:preprotein translocase subunit YajC [Legionella gresilensis]